MSAWIEAASGTRVDVDDIDVSMVSEEDIAHSLSMQCRYNGHTLGFYSVAEHSCLVSDWVLQETSDPSHAFRALLHDAPEAYLSDLPAPVKALLPDYRRLEARFERVIAQRFDLPSLTSKLIREADRRIVVDERRVLFKRTAHRWATDGLKELDAPVRRLEPMRAKESFLSRFYVLKSYHLANTTGATA